MNEPNTEPTPSVADYSDNGVQYAGFWSRSGSLIVDGFLFMPFMMLMNFIVGLHRPVPILIINVFFAIVIQLYITMCHAFFGATLGKMATGIQLRQLNLDEVGWSESLKRNSIDYLFAVGTISSTAILLLTIPSENVLNLSIEEFAEFSSNRTTILDSTIVVLSFIWTVSEVIVLLFNKKKRAIHDFLAGTVVVVKQSLPKRLATA